MLEAWAGLGYNRRARHLHQAACAIVERHGGSVPPTSRPCWRCRASGPTRPGRCCVFAFEHHEAVVDVNVARVLARAVAGQPVVARRGAGLADALVPRGRSWEWNQSLMEIGAVAVHGPCPGVRPVPAGASAVPWANAPGDRRPTRRRPARARARFEGSDRQGRGRLVDALRSGPVPPRRLRRACGWPDDPERARRVADALVADGLARRGPGNVLVLP